MNSAVVLWPNNGPIMSIDLNVVDTASGQLLLQKNMARDPKEACSKTLERMRMLLGDKRGKEGKGKKLTREEILANVPSATILDKDNAVMDISRPNGEVWRAAKVLTLGEHKLSVAYNLPTVTSVSPPPTMTVGAPAVCGNISIMFCKEEDLLVEWICEGMGVVSNNRVFFPQLCHVGKGMRFRCRPRAPESLWTEITLPPVQPPAANATAMARWQHTVKRADAEDPNAFRVVSYNVLHEAFCVTNFAKTQIYPFAKPEVLDINYRKGVIATELKAYNSDIILLQEVGQNIYNAYYVHALRAMGFTSRYFNKAGLTKEGSVIAFNTQRFEVVGGEAVPLTYATLATHHPELAKELDSHPHAKEGVENMTALGSLAVLKDKRSPNRLLVVACTHLFYHPDGCHIRALQAYMLACAMDRLKKQHEAEGVEVHVLLGGDFNFTRSTGAYELLTSGSVKPERDCWDKGFKFWWGCHHGLGNGEGGVEEVDEDMISPAEKAVKAAETVASGERPVGVNTRDPPTEVFRPHLVLPSGLTFVDTHKDEPTLKHTNYTMTFKEIIDHIFIGRDATATKGSVLSLVRTIPLPDDADLSANVAIPNASYPSDHVALVADLTFKSQ